MSLSRYCSIYKAQNGRWFLDLATREYGDRADATTYGPFASETDAEAELDRHANPGSLYIDSSGTAPVPVKSPNGRPIQAATRDAFASFRGLRR